MDRVESIVQIERKQGILTVGHGDWGDIWIK
jgi:hypothetical protein